MADLLRAHQGWLVERYKARVPLLLAPQGFTHSELEESLPGFLEALLQALQGQAFTPSRVLSRVGFNVDALTREYGLLRELIFELLEETGTVPPLRELRILSDCISVATADAVTQYVAYSQSLQREGQARLQAIIDNAPAAIYVTDLEGRCIVANRRLETIFGLPKSEILGKTDYERLPREVADATRGNDRRVLEANAPLELEEVIPQQDGVHTYISLKFPLHDTEGRPNAVGGISTDITERMQAQQALHQAQERLRTVLGRMPIVLWTLDARGIITLMEGNGLKRLGMGPEPHVGRSLLELTQGTPWTLANVRRALAGEELVAEEEAAGGWFEVHYLPHRTPEGTVEAVMGLTVEVTERKRAQDFQQRLLGIVGHDIRNPLSVISLSAMSLLRSGELASDHLRSVQRISSSTSRIEKLVATLLDYTRVQFDQPLPLQPEAVSLDALAEQACDEVRVAYPTAQVRLAATGDTRGQWDVGRMIQVMGNLLTNAVRHGAPDTAVWMRCWPEQATVAFEVTNQGPPIPEPVRAHLFRPFRRGPQDKKEAKQGLGLGLYIVREIVTAHGGTVTVESTPERGTTFTVRLPRVQGSSA